MADKNYISGHVLGHNASASTMCLLDCNFANDTVLTQFTVLLLSFSQILKVLGQNLPS